MFNNFNSLSNDTSDEPQPINQETTHLLQGEADSESKVENPRKL